MAEKPNRVLFIGTFLSSSSGLRTVCEDLAERLTATGDTVLTTSSRSTRFGRLLDMLATTWRRRHAYSVAHVDVYSGRAFLWAEIVTGLLRRIKRPYIVTLHGGNLPAFDVRWPKRVRRLLLDADAVTAPSGYLVEHFRAYRSDIQLIPNAVDVQAYAFRHRKHCALRLVWLRAFHALYNPLLAVETVELLRRRWPEVRLTMIGPDKGDGTLNIVRDRISRSGLGDHVTLRGAVSKQMISESLNASGDIFLHTSNVDNYPITVLEAMACGLCVIATRVGGIPYLINHEVDGVLVPPRSADALSAAVQHVASDPCLSSRISRNARQHVECLDWAMVLPTWRQLLAAVSNGQR